METIVLFLDCEPFFDILVADGMDSVVRFLVCCGALVDGDL